MAVQHAFPGMRRINHYVPSLSYAKDVDTEGMTTVDIDVAPITADDDGILATQSINAAGNTSVFASTYDQNNRSIPTRQAIMSKYGRNVTVVADSTATSTVTITGYDYLGQRIVEVLTLNSGTPVVGQKCFYEIDNIAWAGTASRTINVGWGNRLGVPYKLLSTQILGELVSDATPTAGALTAGVTAQTTTSSDPRGYYTPQASYVPNGSRKYRFTAFVDRSNLHGSAHVTA